MKPISLRCYSLFLLLFLGAPSENALAENPEQLSSAVAIERIYNQGAPKALASFYGSKQDWRALLEGVGSGDEQWLSDAVQLKPVADAGASEQMSLAVGEALEHSPINVFSIAFPAYVPASVCGSPDIDDDRYDSYDLAMAAINRRIRKVETSIGPEFNALRIDCVQRLEVAKAGIARFYAAKKQ